jgi:hypothetical protein
MAGDAQSPGIAQLAFSQIFDQIKRSPQMRYNISLSIMEIYQDTIYDLFARRAKVEMQSGGACGLRFQVRGGKYSLTIFDYICCEKDRLPTQARAT